MIYTVRISACGWALIISMSIASCSMGIYMLHWRLTTAVLATPRFGETSLKATLTFFWKLSVLAKHAITSAASTRSMESIARYTAQCSEKAAIRYYRVEKTEN